MRIDMGKSVCNLYDIKYVQHISNVRMFSKCRIVSRSFKNNLPNTMEMSFSVTRIAYPD